MAGNLHEDVVRVTGNVFERNLRKVLIAEGYSGKALETKIKELMQKDVSRLAAIILAPRQPQA